MHKLFDLISHPKIVQRQLFNELIIQKAKAINAKHREGGHFSFAFAFVFPWLMIF